MTISPAHSILAEPQGDERISRKTLAYVSEAARDELYDLVIRSCVEAGVNKATLAKRLGKDPAQISRLLGAPGNWTIDTFAELLFAIDGRMLRASSYWPLRENVANRRLIHCFVKEAEPRVKSWDGGHDMITKTRPRFKEKKVAEWST